MAWQRIKVKVSTLLNPDLRKRLGEEIVDIIKARTEKGLDKNNDKFPPYSIAYINSREFKAAGKRRNKVNLILTNEMMDSLKVLGHSLGSITIGFDKNDEEVNAKAEGNILGSYSGQPNKGKARDFLGIKKEEFSKIENRLIKDRARQIAIARARKQIIEEVAKKIKVVREGDEES